MLNILKELNNIKSRLNELESIPTIERDILLGQIRELYTMVAEADTVREDNSTESFELEAGTEVGTEVGTEAGTEAGTETDTGDFTAADSSSKPEGEPAGKHSDNQDKIVLKDETEAGMEKPAEDQESVPEPDIEESTLPSDSKSSDQKDKKPSPEILAEKYQSGKSYINERLAHKNGAEDLSSKLQSKPIKDIAAAIGINDKYKLIRDLFKGNPDIFEETIIQLNEASNFNEAFKYINSNFDWEMEDESVQLLLDLVRRKFIVNKNG